MYRNSLAFTVYDTDTTHLLTRHHKTIPPKGYLGPLTYTLWLFFIASIAIIIAVLHYANSIIMGNVDLADISPILFMFHYEERSMLVNKISVLTLGRIVVILSVFINFAFLNTYNQNIRSSTIEPFFEVLPNHIREVNSRESLVLIWENLHMAFGFRQGP